MLEQVLPNLKTTLTTYLQAEATKLNALSGLSTVTVPVPGSGAIYIDPVSDAEIFNHSAVIIFMEARSTPESAGGEDGRHMGATPRVVDWTHEIDLRVRVLGDTTTTLGTYLRRLVEAVRVTLERYGWSSGATTNTGQPYYIATKSIEWGGINGRENATMTKEALLTIAVTERTETIYTDI